MSKSELGQFYTTNYEYILQNMYIPDNISTIIEPFCGNGDLLKFIKNKDKYKLELYDISSKKKNIIKQDTLKNVPDYDNKFVLTNPPYLARNKNKNKELYDKYKTNDLYKCFILNLIDSKCAGGIIIIPLNFISSIRKNDISIRKKFITKFEIKCINIFEEKVFDDTTYTICSILFISSKKEAEEIPAYLYPSNKTFIISLHYSNNYTIGGELYKLPINKDLKIDRATKNTKNKKEITNILLKCIDDNTKLGLYIVSDEERFIDNTEKLSSRSYATLVINKTMSLENQKNLVDRFNYYIGEKRKQYNSLFLPTYREGTRKRISFELAFRICNYLLSNE